MIRISIIGLLALFLFGSINQARAETGNDVEFAPSLTKQDIELANKDSA